MAINRSVNHTPVSVAEAQLARVAGEGCARHPHLNSLLELSGPSAASDLPTRCICCAACTDVTQVSSSSHCSGARTEK